MSQHLREPSEQTWVAAELQDNFDEELELEIDDDRLAEELRDIAALRHEVIDRPSLLLP